jgi:peptidoglycan/LPS O-acetylase OafA/YrhL
MTAIASIPTNEAARFPLSDEPGRRVLGFDILRAIAILLVASGHMLAAFAVPKDIATFGKPVWIMMFQLAVAGVDLFYVLSGFLIGGMLLSELKETGTIDVLRFYGRRALRLWPSYFLAVLFASQWYGRFVKEIDGEIVHLPRLTEMWPFFFQVQNYYDVHVHHRMNIGAIMQTWTLASLVHFYIAIPLLLLLLQMIGGTGRGGRLPLLPWVVGVIVAACLWMRWRVAPVDHNGYNAWQHYFPTHLRMDEMMAGVLAAYWVLHARPIVNRVMEYWPALLVAGILALAPVGLRREEGPRFLIIWGYTVAGFGCLALVMVAWWMAERRRESPVTVPAPWPLRWFARIGVWSYSIYLWHQPLAQYCAPKVRAKLFGILIHRGFDPWHSQFQYLMSAMIFFAFVLGIGGLMYYLIERPSLILRDRLLPRRGRNSIAG